MDDRIRRIYRTLRGDRGRLQHNVLAAMVARGARGAADVAEATDGDEEEGAEEDSTPAPQGQR